MSGTIYTQGTATFLVPVNQSVAVYTVGECRVFQDVGYPNFPSQKDLLGTVINGTTTFGPFTKATQVIVEASAAPVLYDVGTAPTALFVAGGRVQPNPAAINVTATLDAGSILRGIITSTTAAAVNGTLESGANMELATNWRINDAFDWAVVNTGPNALTVVASTGHTLVGAAAVATATSALFRTRKTALNTFVTYRLSV